MGAAFSELLAACDGASCDGACRVLFNASYRSCLRGYQPFVVVDGMNNASIRAIVESCMPPLCSDDGGGDGCSQRIRNVPAVVQVYIPSQDMRTLRCTAPKRQQKSTQRSHSGGQRARATDGAARRVIGFFSAPWACCFPPQSGAPFSKVRIGWGVEMRCRDYRLTWAAVLLAFDVVHADRSLFRGWNVSWTLRCAAGVLARVLINMGTHQHGYSSTRVLTVRHWVLAARPGGLDGTRGVQCMRCGVT